MKKIVFTLALVIGAGLIVQAQDTADNNGPFRPVGGDKNLEVQFAPLGGTPISIPGIKFRSFSGNNTAFRLGIFVGYMNESTITQEEQFNDDDEQTGLELSDRSNSFSVAIQPGYEWHMTGTDRLSPYVGGFVNIGYTSETDIMETEHPLGDVPGTPINEQLYQGDVTTKTGQLNLGLNLVAGFDYYFAQRLYIGTEIGFGFSMDNDLSSTTTTNDTQLNTDTGIWEENSEEVDSVVGNQKGFQIGPNVIGQIRVGWLF